MSASHSVDSLDKLHFYFRKLLGEHGIITIEVVLSIQFNLVNIVQFTKPWITEFATEPDYVTGHEEPNKKNLIPVFKNFTIV